MRPCTRPWPGVAALLTLALLLVGCGGAGAKSPGTHGASATSTKPASTGRAAATGVNTLTFTASGGLTGPISLSSDLATGSANMLSYHLASEQRFYVDLTDQTGRDQQQFILDFTGYNGPGSYTVSPVQAGAAADENIQFSIIVPGSDIGTDLWQLDKSTPGACTVVVSSVAPVAHLANDPGATATHPTSGYSEVHGTIACPSVPVYIADGSPPLVVSDGHFDFLMAEQQ
jgi:hypothetical protein